MPVIISDYAKMSSAKYSSLADLKAAGAGIPAFLKDTENYYFKASDIQILYDAAVTTDAEFVAAVTSSTVHTVFIQAASGVNLQTGSYTFGCQKFIYGFPLINSGNTTFVDNYSSEIYADINQTSSSVLTVGLSGSTLTKLRKIQNGTLTTTVTSGSAVVYYEELSGASVPSDKTGFIKKTFWNNTNKTEAYVLPLATADALGGVKVGTGLSIDANGKLNVTYSYTLPAATAEVLGGIKVGNGVSIDADGKLNVTYSYTLPAATASILGGIKIGNGLKIDSSGIANPTVNNINVSTGADATFALTQDANTVITCTNTPTLTLTTGTTGMYSAQIVGAAKINTIEGVTWSGKAITAVTTIGEISILNGLAVGTAV